MSTDTQFYLLPEETWQFMDLERSHLEVALRNDCSVSPYFMSQMAGERVTFTCRAEPFATALVTGVGWRYKGDTEDQQIGEHSWPHEEDRVESWVIEVEALELLRTNNQGYGTNRLGVTSMTCCRTCAQSDNGHYSVAYREAMEAFCSVPANGAARCDLCGKENADAFTHPILRIVQPDFPLEKALAELWVSENERCPGHNRGHGVLQDLMLAHFENSTDQAFLNERERHIAALAVQWVGSPIGMCFLRKALYNAGYPEGRVI